MFQEMDSSTDFYASAWNFEIAKVSKTIFPSWFYVLIVFCENVNSREDRPTANNNSMTHSITSVSNIFIERKRGSSIRYI